VSACIVGVGQTRYTKWGGQDESEYALALQAIVAAVADAGLEMSRVDGLASFADDRNLAVFAAADLGLAELRHASMSWLPGGGGGSAAVAAAALAVEAGQADVVVVYRSLCQGQFSRFGQGPGSGGSGSGGSGSGGSGAGGSGGTGGAGAGGTRPRRAPGLRRAKSLLDSHAAFTMPFGMVSPPVTYAMVMQRHMHRFGTTGDHLGNVAVRFRDHAIRNPNAVLRDPMTLDDYHASRWVAEPFHLFDCCMENDGACAVVVTRAEVAADLAQPVVEIAAMAQGSPGAYGHGQYLNVYVDDDLYSSGGGKPVARDLWARGGIGPDEVDVAMLYDHFSGMVLLQVEDYGFCGPGEGGPWFAESNLPMNTHGGSLSEAYIHGLNHVVEGVRQLQGRSTTPVPGAETALVTSAAGVPGSALVLRRAR
jgi:acetyl-CoA acetyltransferase